MSCKIEGCEHGGPFARGWCNMHYKRWRAHGDPLVNLKPRHETQHGTVNEYVNYGCRCDLCKAAMAAKNAAVLKTATCTGCGARIWAHANRTGLCIQCLAASRTLPIEERHGTEVGYSKGCRCDECRRAAADARRQRRHENETEEQKARALEQRRRRRVARMTPMQRATSRVAQEMR